jgi:hypothetical protein
MCHATMATTTYFTEPINERICYIDQRTQLEEYNLKFTTDIKHIDHLEL